ncbi:hypothetical protein HN873_044830 [Arachis hypogaea]
MKATEQGKATCIGSASWNGSGKTRLLLALISILLENLAKKCEDNSTQLGEDIADAPLQRISKEMEERQLEMRLEIKEARRTPTEGLPILDCSSQVSFGFEMWHLELFTGFVVFISSSLRLLLNTWTDFADSSQAANLQVLCSLQPLDCMFVAFLPGISEVKINLLFLPYYFTLFGLLDLLPHCNILHFRNYFSENSDKMRKAQVEVDSVLGGNNKLKVDKCFSTLEMAPHLEKVLLFGVMAIEIKKKAHHCNRNS